MVARKVPENHLEERLLDQAQARASYIFSLAHVAPLPAQAVEHPNTILEPNLDSNAIPTLSLLLTTTPNCPTCPPPPN